MKYMDHAGHWIRTVLGRSLVTAFALALTMGTPVLAQQGEDTLTAEEYVECMDYSSPLLLELSGGDGEYWKYYDTEGQPVQYAEEDGLSVSGSLEDLYGTINSPYTHVSYTVKGEYGVEHGIDVSRYQDSVDWKRVKQSGIDYAIIRCGFRSYTSGALYEDETFHEKMQGALKAGLKVGVYVFSQALTESEAVEEAEFCLKTCSRYLDQMDLPIVIDYEYVAGGRLTDGKLSAAAQTSICSRFCKVIAAAGYQPMVYANKSLLSEDFNPREITAKGYRIWLANYISKTTYNASPYSIWQYSENGSVPGVNTKTDMNFIYLDDVSDALKLHLSGADASRPVLTWDSKIGAEGYEIQSSSDRTSWKMAASLDGANRTFWQDSGVGGTVYYRIRTVYSANGKTAYGKWSDEVYVSNQMQAPVINAVECVDYHTLKISWNSVREAAAYQVDRRTGDGDWETVSHVDTPYYVDAKAVPNTEYIYRVRAVAGTVENVEYGLFSAETTGMASLAVPSMKKAETITCSSIRVAWDSVKDAEGYRIYRREVNGSWKIVADNYKNTSYTDKTVKCGESYYYTVRAYRREQGIQIWGFYERPGILGQAAPAMVKSIKVSSADYKTLKITWSKVDGAQGYRIYRKKAGGSWTRVDDVGASVTQYRDSKGIKCGETWYYTVRCYHITDGRVVLGVFNDSLACGKAVPETPSVRISTPSKGTVEFNWKKIAGADGYTISAKAGNAKDYERVATLKDGSKVSCKIKAASGVKISYRICAFRKVNGKTYFSDSQSGLKATAK